MNKVLTVFAREYTTQVRSKAFLITLIMMPILMSGSILIAKFVGDRSDTKDRKIAVIDYTGVLYDKIEADAEAYNKDGIKNDEGKQTKPRFLLQKVEPAEDALKQRLELSDQVRAKKLFAFVEIGKNLVSGAPTEQGDFFRYYSNSPTDREFLQWLRGPLNKVVMSQRFEVAKLPAQVVANAIRPIDLENLGLVKINDKTGEIEEAVKADRMAAFLVPYGFCMLMFMAIMVTGPQMMQNVIEEKMQRIAEVLIGSIPPFQLMLGKLLGLVGVSLTLLGLYLAGGWFVADYFDRGDLIPVDMIAWIIGYATLAIIMFGSMFSAIGASVSEAKDAQSLMMPVTMIVIIPLMLLGPIIKAPNGSLATWVSFFPPATPMMMVTRMAVPPGIPAWQPWVGIIGVVLFTIVCVFAAGRVFRIGLLLQGKTPKLGEIMRWAITG